MRHLLKLSVPTLAACFLLAACGSSKSSTATPSNAPATQTTGSAGATVKTASSSLGTILVNAQGMTLYHLSVEQNGKFICTSTACTGIWHPLTVPAGSTPSGEVGSLSTVKRPDGTTQVTYKGTPLYTFASDQRPGETKGQGVKDVGTWSAVTTGGSAPGNGTQTSAPSEGGSGGGYGY
jgi:predicted lipoprotein with Yx(FWY)xxD motif